MSPKLDYYLFVDPHGERTYARAWNAVLKKSSEERIHLLLTRAADEAGLTRDSQREVSNEVHGGLFNPNHTGYSRIGVIIRVVDLTGRGPVAEECRSWLRWNGLSWTLWCYVCTQGHRTGQPAPDPQQPPILLVTKGDATSVAGQSESHAADGAVPHTTPPEVVPLMQFTRQGQPLSNNDKIVSTARRLADTRFPSEVYDSLGVCQIRHLRDAGVDRDLVDHLGGPYGLFTEVAAVNQFWYWYGWHLYKKDWWLAAVDRPAVVDALRKELGEDRALLLYYIAEDGEALPTLSLEPQVRLMLPGNRTVCFWLFPPADWLVPEGASAKMRPEKRNNLDEIRKIQARRRGER